jgi:alpha-L-fucosidase
MERRTFLMTAAAASALALCPRHPIRAEKIEEIYLSPTDDAAAVERKAAMVRPSPRQLAWQALEFAAFIHFGINTFTGRQWGTGREKPADFNPSALDAGQWAAAARDGGMRELILTAKHHDGFCLWPSAHTEHSLKHSPWRGGEGDVVREAAEACRAAGLKFGVYLSPWDRHEKTYGTPAYNDYFKAQLRELLTGYGEIAEVWFDGAGMGRKHKRMVGLYDWPGIVDLVRELQPGAVVSISGPDVRWCGNEAGKGRLSEWSVVPGEPGIDYKETDPDLGSRDKLMAAAPRGARLAWKPAQVDVSIRPNWFYTAWDDDKVKSLGRLLDIYFDSVGGNAQLLLNLPPDRRGLVHENDAARLHELRAALDETFSVNLAAGAKATASAERAGFAAGNVVAGDAQTYWTTADGVRAAEVELDLGAARTFNVARIKEAIREGQRIEQFTIEYHDGGAWRPAAAGTTVGDQRLLRFPAVTAARVRLRIESSRVRPTLSELGLFNCIRAGG